MKFTLLALTLLLLAPLALADNRVSPATEKEILRNIFILRKELKLPALKRSPVLDRVAARSAIGNLQRVDHIEHSDADGKTLAERVLEEKYPGAAGEIVAALYRPCSEVGEETPENYARILGEGFQDSIRNSPRHYRGLTDQTGRAWTEFGVSILHHQEILDGRCADKTVLTLCVGLP